LSVLVQSIAKSHRRDESMWRVARYTLLSRINQSINQLLSIRLLYTCF